MFLQGPMSVSSVVIRKFPVALRTEGITFHYKYRSSWTNLRLFSHCRNPWNSFIICIMLNVIEIFSWVLTLSLTLSMTLKVYALYIFNIYFRCFSHILICGRCQLLRTCRGTLHWLSFLLYWLVRRDWFRRRRYTSDTALDFSITLIKNLAPLSAT